MDILLGGLIPDSDWRDNFNFIDAGRNEVLETSRGWDSVKIFILIYMTVTLNLEFMLDLKSV